MMITNMELLRAKLAYKGVVTESEILKDLINSDKNSAYKEAMREGQRYYDGNHDIFKIDFRKKIIYDDENNHGTVYTNENKSNYHLVHNFYALLVDQKTGYIVGKAPSVTVVNSDNSEELKAFEKLVNAVTSRESFTSLLADLVEGASNKGVEWIHPYYGFDGKLRFVVSPAEGIIACKDTSNQAEITDIIKYYSVNVIIKGKEKERIRAEWWTSSMVSYFTENEKGDYILEKREPHWYEVTRVDGKVSNRIPKSWGRVPFVPLYNSSSGKNDLVRVKGLIDAYNILSSKTTNDEIDLVELYWLVQGYGAESAKAIQAKLALNGAVSITDSNGRIEGKQVTISLADRTLWIKLIRKDIYNLGMGIDLDDESIGSAPSGVSLEFRYTHLDLKADPLISKLKTTLSECAWFITLDINVKNKTSFDYETVKFEINKSKIINDTETIQNINNSRGLVPDKLLLAKHPYVDDPSQAFEDLQKQREEETKREVERMNLFAGDDSALNGDA